MFTAEHIRAKLRPMLGPSRKKPRRTGGILTRFPSQWGPTFNSVQPRTDDGRRKEASRPTLEVIHREEGTWCRIRVVNRMGPQSFLGPLQPPTPEPLPQTTESVRISNLGRFHFHNPLRQWGVRGLRTSGSVSWAVMGKASSATQIGPHPTRQCLPPHKGSWIGGGGGRQDSALQVQWGVRASALETQLCVWFSHSRDEVWGHLYEMPRILKFIETESGMVFGRSWGEGRTGSYCLMATGFHFCKMKRVLEMNGDDDCTTLFYLKITELYN